MRLVAPGCFTATLSLIRIQVDCKQVLVLHVCCNALDYINIINQVLHVVDFRSNPLPIPHCISRDVLLRMDHPGTVCICWDQVLQASVEAKTYKGPESRPI